MKNKECCAKGEEKRVENCMVCGAALEYLETAGVGPMCCKSFVRTALGVGYNSAKEYFNIHMLIHREKISCFHSNKNYPNCRKEKCLYFPKTA